jgi:hypothetical protein
LFGLYVRVHGVYGLLAVSQLHRVLQPVLYRVLRVHVYRLHALHGRLYRVHGLYRVHEMLCVYVLEMYGAHVYVPYHLHRVQPFAIVWG